MASIQLRVLQMRRKWNIFRCKKVFIANLHWYQTLTTHLAVSQMGVEQDQPAFKYSLIQTCTLRWFIDKFCQQNFIHCDLADFDLYV